MHCKVCELKYPSCPCLTCPLDIADMDCCTSELRDCESTKPCKYKKGEKK